MSDFNLDNNKKGPLSYMIMHTARCIIEQDASVTVSQVQHLEKSGGDLRTSLLDHVYENVCSLVENITEISASTSDHTPLLIDMAIKVGFKAETKIV